MLYGSTNAIITPAIPSFSGHDNPLVDASEGWLDLSNRSHAGGASRVHLQVARYDAAGVEFEGDLQVHVSLNTETPPDPASAAARYILGPGDLISFDLYPHGGTLQKLAYYINRPGTPAGDLVWGISLNINLLY